MQGRAMTPSAIRRGAPTWTRSSSPESSPCGVTHQGDRGRAGRWSSATRPPGRSCARSGDAAAEGDLAVQGLDLLLDRAELVLELVARGRLGGDRVLVGLVLCLQAAQRGLRIGDLRVQRGQLPLQRGQLGLATAGAPAELV